MAGMTISTIWMAHFLRILLLPWLIVNSTFVTAQQVIWYGAWNNATTFRYSTFFSVYVEILVDQRTPVSYDTVVINAASYYGQVGATNFSATGNYLVWVGPLIPQEKPPGPTTLAVKQFTSEVTSIAIHVQQPINQTGLIIYDINFLPAGSSSTTTATASTTGISGSNLIPSSAIFTTRSTSSSNSSSIISYSLSEVLTTTPSSSFPTLINTIAQETPTESGSIPQNPSSSVFSDSKRSKPNVGAIIGGTFAAIIMLGACIFLMARRRRNGRNVMASPNPYPNRKAPTEGVTFSLSVAEITKLAAELAQTDEQTQGNRAGMASAPPIGHTPGDMQLDGAPPAYFPSPISPSQSSLLSPSIPITTSHVTDHSDSTYASLVEISTRSKRLM